MFDTVVQTLGYVLGAAFFLFAFYGFWRGLSLGPHAPEHRAAENLHWWSHG